MDEKQAVTVYRFEFLSPGGRSISPGHMWGTLAAISTLVACTPIQDTARTIHAALLDAAGFYFEQVPSAIIQIEEPRRAA